MKHLGLTNVKRERMIELATPATKSENIKKH